MELTYNAAVITIIPEFEPIKTDLKEYVFLIFLHSSEKFFLILQKKLIKTIEKAKIISIKLRQI